MAVCVLEELWRQTRSIDLFVFCVAFSLHEAGERKEHCCRAAFHELFERKQCAEIFENKSFMLSGKHNQPEEKSIQSCLLVDLSEPLFEYEDNQVRGMWKTRNNPKQKNQHYSHLVLLFLNIPGS